MRTAQEQSEFMASRMQGIGGSDIGSLLSNQIEVEYGCERRLWYRLSGYPADGADNATEPMLLGNILESHIVRAYSDKTGNRVEQMGLKKHPTISCLQYHDDGIIHPCASDERTTPGVLECKAIGREMMAKVNTEGLPADYVLQGQSGIGAHGLEWSDYAVGTRDDLLPLVAIELTAKLAGEPIPTLPRQPKIVNFQVRRDDNIVALIEDYAPRFWATLKDESKLPPRMEPEDPRCARCQYQNLCQGAAVMAGIEPELSIPRRNDLNPLINEYQTRSALLEEATALVKETQDKFRNELGATTAVKVQIDGKWKNILYRLTKGRQSIDGPRLAAQYDALRRAAIDAGLIGADLTPPSGTFMSSGMPYRTLRLSSVLPKKEKKKGEVSETEDSDDE